MSDQNELAGRDLRWLAFVLDAAVRGAAVFGGLGVGLAVAEVGGPLGPLTGAMVGWGAVSVLNWALVVRDGQTVGKRWVDIRIVSVDGHAVGFLDGVVFRSWLFAALGAGCGWGLSVVDAAFVLRGDRRALHDRVAGTKVVVGTGRSVRARELARQ